MGESVPRSASTPLETLSAGRELDVLVAEKILGWEVGVSAQSGRYCLPPDSTRSEYAITWNNHDSKLPCYSTDIASAWQVVEKMREKGYEVCIGLVTDGVFCRMDDEPGECAGRASVDWRDGSTPLAICLAALRTVDVLPSESEAQK